MAWVCIGRCLLRFGLFQRQSADPRRSSSVAYDLGPVVGQGNRGEILGFGERDECIEPAGAARQQLYLRWHALPQSAGDLCSGALPVSLLRESQAFLRGFAALSRGIAKAHPTTWLHS